MASISIRTMAANDWPDVLRIYAEGIATGTASCETDIPDWPAWNAGHLAGCRLIAEKDGSIAGWAALMPVSARACFHGVAEVSIYVGTAARGAGTGRALLEALIPASEAAGMWTLWSSIHADNPASIALHEGCGFRWSAGAPSSGSNRAAGWRRS